MSEVDRCMEPDGPIDFGRKMSWLAVRGADIDKVVQAFDIRETAPSSWAKGLELASEWDPPPPVFITPPLTVANETWILIVGCGLPDPSGPEDIHEHWRSEVMERGAEAFGEVQYFANHRVSSYTAWARLRRGEELRLFCHGDEPIRDEGEVTGAEKDLMEEFETRDPEEDDVMTIASHWSVNPMELTELDLGQSLGQTGYFPMVEACPAPVKQQSVRWWASFKGLYRKIAKSKSASTGRNLSATDVKARGTISR